MTISYTALLGLAQPVTGTETGQWGTVVNDEITALLEDAVANAASISVTAGNVTLSTTNGSSNQARMSTLIITGTPGTTRNVVAPSQAKIYVVINQSDGAVVIKGAATSGVTIGAGQTAQVAWNGSDFVEIGNYVHGNFVVNGNLSVNGDSTLGNAGADTTTINGQVIAANSNISKTTTLSASAPALAWIKGATYTDTGTAGGTTQALAPFTVFSTPTLSTSNIVTYTDAATVYIAGAPAAAGSATITNPYSLYVAAGNAYFGASVSATTLDLTNLEVTNIKAKDGTASMTLADSTGIITLSATAGTANGVAYLNGSRALTTGSALTFDGTNFNVVRAAATDQYMSLYADGTGPTLKFFGGAAGKIAGIMADSASASMYFTNEGNKPFVYAINGSEQMRLTSTGLGIGTSSPTTKLYVTVSAASTACAAFLNTDTANGNGVYIKAGGANAGKYALAVENAAGASLAYLDSSGNLGLGVTPSVWSQGKAFEISAVGEGLWGNGLGDIWMVNGAYFNSGWKYSGATKATAYRQGAGTTDGSHSWHTAPSGTAGNAISFTQAMTLDASGNLMLGGTSTTQLDGVFGQIIGSSSKTTAGIALETSAGAYMMYTDSTDALIFWDSGSNVERARISSDGTFRVKGAGTAGSTDAVQFSGSAPASSLILDSSGNLGVGTTSPAQRLHVSVNTVGAGAFLQVSNTGDSQTAYFGTNTSGGSIQVVGANPLQFATNGTERARITSGGYFKASDNGTYNNLVGTYHELYQSTVETAVLVSAVNASFANNILQLTAARNTTNNSFYALSYYNSGAGAYKFRVADSGAIATAGSISLGTVTPATSGIGVQFPATQSASSDANTLDDYEEGTFTPAMNFNGSTTGITYDYQFGRYTKIGNVVNVQIGVVLTNKGSATGVLQIAGLPFTSVDPGPYGDGALAISFCSAATATTPMMAIVQRGNTQLGFNFTTTASSDSVDNTDVTNTFAIILGGSYISA